MPSNHRLAIAAFAALILSACFEKPRISDPTAGGSAANGQPTIAGVPPTSIQAGLAYEFTPAASDADGDALTFSVSNKPAWAQFDETTGRLWGTPQAADVGIEADIKISVTDGAGVAELPRFSIAVHHVSTGSATLSWYPPTQNADGSALIDLAGYRIYYGRSADALDLVITIKNAGLARYVVESLPSATWHFSMTSYNSRGVESARSPTVSKTVS